SEADRLFVHSTPTMRPSVTEKTMGPDRLAAKESGRPCVLRSRLRLNLPNRALSVPARERSSLFCSGTWSLRRETKSLASTLVTASFRPKAQSVVSRGVTESDEVNEPV